MVLVLLAQTAAAILAEQEAQVARRVAARANATASARARCAPLLCPPLSAVRQPLCPSPVLVRGQASGRLGVQAG
eukprot:COSAG01_NODE_171_length_23132_cov_53.865118_31_plen_75_part_00